MLSPLVAVAAFVSFASLPNDLQAQPPAEPSAPSAVVALGRVTLRDAPVSQGGAFAASALTGATGLVSLISLLAGPPIEAPGTLFSRHARVATALFLMSVGPSMGDLLSADLGGFLLGAGGRVVMAGIGYATVMALEGQWQNAPLAVLTGVLFTGLLGLAWTAWGLVDLTRSAFAPQRWVTRQNRPLRAAHPEHPTRQAPSRQPPAAVPGEPGLFRM